MKNALDNKRDYLPISALSESEFHAELKDMLDEEMTEDETFLWLFDLTCEVYNIDQHKIQCSNGMIKRWRDLADLWGSCASARTELNMFELAFHKIHWGILPHNFSVAFPAEAIDTVANMLKDTGNPSRGWRLNHYYRKAFKNIIILNHPIGMGAPRKRSEWFLRYVCARTWLEVAYHGTEPSAFDLSRYTQSELKSAKKHAKIYADVSAYETVMTRLIPEASSWNDKEWRNERLLYNKLKNLYSLDSTDGYSDFDGIVSFLVDMWYYNVTSVKKLIEINAIPDSMLAAIWPRDTKQAVIKLLHLAHGRVKSATTFRNHYGLPEYGCTAEKLKSSWVFNICRSWLYSGDLSVKETKTRKIIFEYETGIVA